MFLAKKLLSALILPPAGPLLLALFGLWLAGRKSRRWQAGGRWLAGLSVLTLLALSLPVVSRQLAIEAIEQAVDPKALHSAQAIVILGAGVYRNAPEYGSDSLAGNALERTRYGAWLARQSGLPVLASGGAPGGGTPEGVVMAKVLAEDFRIQVRWIEDKSRDTGEQAQNCGQMLLPAGIRRIALVSHAIHLPRAIPLFEAAGFDVLPAATLIPRERPLSPYDLMPNAGTLARSSERLHELLGRLFNLITRQNA